MSETNPAELIARTEEYIAGLPEQIKGQTKRAINQVLQAYLRDKEPKDRFKLHTASEALQPQPPIQWVVERVFSAGSVNLVVGEAKSKKTYSLLDACVAVALGKKWLDFSTQQTAVLIIDEESGLRRMNLRLGNALRGHNAGPNTPIHYVTLAGFNLSNDTDYVHIQELIEQTGARFVVIDALIDVLGGADENDASQVQAAFSRLRKIAEETKACIVVIHHNGKSGAYRGSSAMKGAVDLLLTVASKPGSNKVEFNMEAPRDTEPISFAATANFGETTFNLSPSAATVAARSYSEAQAFVLGFLEENGPSEITEMCSRADICSAVAARKAVYSLAAINKVKRVDGGGAGVKAVYAINTGST